MECKPTICDLSEEYAVLEQRILMLMETNKELNSQINSDSEFASYIKENEEVINKYKKMLVFIKEQMSKDIAPIEEEKR